MNADSSNMRYGRTARIAHWLIALLLLGQFALGFWLDTIPRNTAPRGYFINLHKSFGLVIGLLILLRIYWRFRHPPPPPHIVIAPWQQRLAAATHHLLYVCMVVMPLSGYLASNFSRHGIKFFNAVTWVPWGPDDKTLYALFNLTHKVTAALLLALVMLHLLAALWHALRRDGIFSRIWLFPYSM